MGTTRRRPSAAEGLCSVILALNLTWCSLEGHAEAFAASTFAIDALVNSRALWLCGLCATSALFIVAPGWSLHRDRFLKTFLPALGSLGTLALAFAPAQSVVDEMLLACSGLVLSGACHFWTSARTVLLEARTARFEAIARMLVMAVLIKTVVLLVAPAVLPPVASVWIAVAIPLVNAALFEAARRFSAREARRREGSVDGVPTRGRGGGSRDGGPRTDGPRDGGPGVRTVFGVPALPRGEDPGARSRVDYVLLTIMAGFLLATIRRLSFWGLWGASAQLSTELLDGLVQLGSVAVSLAAFAWFALIRTRSLPNPFRFQPAVALVTAGLFLAAVELPAEWSHVSSSLFHIDEACAYVLFWSVAAVSLDVQRIRSMRLLGLSGVSFGVPSLFWVVTSGYIDDIEGAFMALAAYAVVVMAMVFVYRESKAGELGAATVRGGAGGKAAGGTAETTMGGTAGEIAGTTVGESAEAGRAGKARGPAAPGRAVAEMCARMESGPAADPAPLAASIAERCAEISAAYGLTARESDVFLLLAQGRTRAYIQRELVLSDSTVKTHVSHIYTKLGVRNRQGMMDLVLAEVGGEGRLGLL